MWSFILGRPPMAPKGTYDVLALPAENNADGSPNPCASYHKALIALSDIIDDTMGKVRTFLVFTLAFPLTVR